MKKLIHQFSQKQLKNILLSLALLGIAACTGSNQITDNNQSLDRQLLIDTTGIIPVINGKPTNSGVYIHNLSNETISNINYHILNNSSDYKLDLDDKEECREIVAGGSCLLKFTTPKLGLGTGASALLIAEYDAKQSKQLLNYQYVDSHNYTGASFNSPLIHLNRSHPYATIYAFNPSENQGYSNKLELDNNSSQIINGVKDNKLNLAANQVLPVELKIANTIMDRQTKIYFASDKSRPVMQIMVSPENKANLLVGTTKVLDLAKANTTKFTLYNNGVTIANVINLTTDNVNKVSVSPDSENGCNQGGSLEPGASCNYLVTVLDKSNSDSRLLFLNYNNGVDEVHETHSLTYISSTKVASLQITPEVTELLIDGGNTAETKFTLYNLGDLPLQDIQAKLHKLLQKSTANINSAKSNCSNSLAGGSSCQQTVMVNAASNYNEKGVIYLTADGNVQIKEAKHYNFASLPLKIEVIDKTQLMLTDFRPLDKAVNVRTNSNIELMFNKPIDSTTVNSPNVRLETTSGEIINLLPGVAIDDKHISLLPNVPLSENTLYKIVINQTAITDLNGKALGENTHYIAGSFTTGDFTAPAITSYTPVNGQTNVSISNPDISVQFSEAMDASTIDTNSIYLENITKGVKTSGITPLLENDENKIRMVLAEGISLDKSNQYNLIIDESRLKDKAGNPVGTNNKRIVTSFITTDGKYPANSLTTTITGCFKGSGNSTSPCYDNTDITGGKGSNIKLNLTFTNNDSKIIDRIELAVSTINALQQQGFTLDYNSCEQQILSGTSCSIIYIMPASVKNTPLSLKSNWGALSYNLYYDSLQNSANLTTPIDYDIRVVNPTMTIQSFNAQIRNATKTISLSFANLYNTFLDVGDIISSQLLNSKSCGAYNSTNNTQVCNITLAAVSSIGNRTLVIDVWGTAVSANEAYEVARLIFVSNTSYTGNFGGMDGADSKCNLSSNGKPAGTTAEVIHNNSKSTYANARYFNENDQFIGTGVSGDEFRSTLSAPIGSGSSNVWFGNSDYDCSSWSSSSSDKDAIVGSAGATSSSWRNATKNPCSNKNYLYCVTK